jgi:hypothetical protein
MIKFDVRKESFEFDPTKHSTPEEAYWALCDHDDKRIDIFDTKEEAIAAMMNQKPTTCRLGHKLAQATVFFVSSGDYDQTEDGELDFISGSDVCMFSFEPLPKEDE